MSTFYPVNQKTYWHPKAHNTNNKLVLEEVVAGVEESAGLGLTIQISGQQPLFRISFKIYSKGQRKQNQSTLIRSL